MASSARHLHAIESIHHDDDLARLLRSAVEAQVAAIVVAPTFAKTCVERLAGTGIAVRSVVSYPLGLSKPTIKAIEATSLAKDGVDALEVTPLPTSLRNPAMLQIELLEIARGARAAKPTIGLHVRLDFAAIRLDDADAIGLAIVRGAFDGIVLTASDTNPPADLLARFASLPLDQKIVHPDQDTHSAVRAPG